MTFVAGNDALAADFNYLFGTVLPYVGRTSPDANWKICDGSAISRATYATLFSIISPTIGTFTVTIAAPGVFTLNSHALVVGDQVYLTTTGALPTGLSINTIYFVISAGLAANTFELSTTRGGSAITTTGSQSGTHTATYCPWGLGDGTTTFNLPNMKGKIPVGYDSTDANVGALNVPPTYVGEKTHQLTVAELASHTHTYNNQANGGGGGPAGGNVSSDSNSGSTGGDTAHNNMQPYVVTNYIIRCL